MFIFRDLFGTKLEHLLSEKKTIKAKQKTTQLRQNITGVLSLEAYMTSTNPT